jgi:hypothetical protein
LRRVRVRIVRVWMTCDYMVALFHGHAKPLSRRAARLSNGPRYSKRLGKTQIELYGSVKVGSRRHAKDATIIERSAPREAKAIYISFEHWRLLEEMTAQ